MQKSRPKCLNIHTASKAFYSLLVLVLGVFVVAVMLQIKTVMAEDAIPRPGNVPCETEKNPEYSSGRPYQASPCGDAPKTYWCGNAVVIYLNTVKCPYNGSPTCTPTVTHYEKKIAVEMLDAELPIMGNTELTSNSVNGTGTMDDGTKLNEYMSWYLNGVNDKAEYPESSIDQSVNMSGPLRRLLPGVIQDAARVEIIKSPDGDTSNVDDETGESTPEKMNHNNIVVCAKEGGGGLLGWIVDLFNVGATTPLECYKGGGSGAQGDVYRLKDWNGNLTILNALSNTVVRTAVNAYQVLFPFASLGEIEASIGNHWNLRRPPLPWDDGTGKPFARNVDYQKAYYEWRGQTCMIIPVIDRLACFENLLVPNKYADLFPYIPLANTRDIPGAHTVLLAHVSAAKAEILESDYQIIKPAFRLWIPHAAENFELTSLLKKTFVPKAKDGASSTAPAASLSDVEINNAPCKILNSRSNPGDDVNFENPKKWIEVDVQYDVGEIQCSEPHEECKEDTNPSSPTYGQTICKMVATCESEVYATIPTVGKTPYADEIWNNSVAGPDSVFRRIYPKTGANAPVSCIADLPAESKATYKITDPSSEGIRLTQVILPDDSRMGSFANKTESLEAKVFYPHYGGVLEYFLNGIQTALRPQGYSDSQPMSGQSCSNIQCGELPDLPKASGSCQLGGVSSRVGKIPKALSDIISAAAQTYKVPPNLLIGQMFGEGLFNPGRYEWTEENVKNWATCTKIPGCNETGDDHFMGFNGTVFERTVPKIKADLQKIDPSRKTFSQCNLLDAIYAAAYNLHDSADGGGGLPATCFGIKLSAPVPSSCSWTDEQYESAIKVYESGYTSMCMTVENGCAIGGLAAACPAGDTCETISNRYSSPSHNACVWDVAHGN